MMNSSSRASKRVGSVLVAVDGSENSNDALTWAAHESVARQAHLTIVHSCSTPFAWDPTGIGHWGPEQHRIRGQALGLLAAAEDHVRTITPDIRVRTVLRTGSAVHAIRSEGRRAGLTVLGRGDGRGRSVTTQVIARSTSPVTVVGAADPGVPTQAANRVVALLLPGQSPASVIAVLEVALTTARRRQWTATVMADWANLWQTELAGALLHVRAHTPGEVDVDTRSLPGSTPPRLSTEVSSAAMVVVASSTRRRLGSRTRTTLDQLLGSSGTFTTFVPNTEHA